MEWRKANREHLRDLAWVWDPIGLPRLPETEGEYDCAIDFAVGVALTGVVPEALADRISEWGEDHYGIRVPSALSFAEGVFAWCKSLKQGGLERT